MRLKGEVALVTGGGTGLGKACVEMLAREGAKVAIAGADVVKSPSNQYGSTNIGGYKAAQELAASLKKDGVDAIAIEADITIADQVQAMVDKTVEAFGRLDILVHAAGLTYNKPVVELKEEEWDLVVNTNLKGTFLVDQAVVRQMLAQGGGRIVNIASMSSKNTYANMSAYSSSKYGVKSFTSCLAKEVAKNNITVNCICPGNIYTKMWEVGAKKFAAPGQSSEEAFAKVCAMMMPQGVPQTGEDIAEGALYLITAPHVTGIALSIDGGVSM